MKEPIHKNKKFLSLFYDKCENLVKNFSDEEIGAILRAAITYELTGEKPEIEDRLILVTVNPIYNDIDMSTEAADKNSKRQSDRAKGKGKKKRGLYGANIVSDRDPEEMTEAEIDDEIDRLFPLSNRTTASHG